MKRVGVSLMLTLLFIIGVAWGKEYSPVTSALGAALAQVHPLLVDIQQQVPISITLTLPPGVTAGEQLTVPAVLDVNLQVRLTEAGAAVVEVGDAGTADATVVEEDAVPAGEVSARDTEAPAEAPAPAGTPGEELAYGETRRKQGILAGMAIEPVGDVSDPYAATTSISAKLSFQNVTAEPKPIHFKAGEEIRLIDGNGEPVVYLAELTMFKHETHRCIRADTGSQLCVAPSCETRPDYQLDPGETAVCTLSIEDWAVDPAGEVLFAVDLAEPDLDPFYWRVPATELPMSLGSSTETGSDTASVSAPDQPDASAEECKKARKEYARCMETAAASPTLSGAITIRQTCEQFLTLCN